MQKGQVYIAPGTAMETPSENSVQLYFDETSGQFKGKGSDGVSFNPSAGTAGQLTTYASNTAAIAGGLSTGDFYKTAGGVVMVVLAA